MSATLPLARHPNAFWLTLLVMLFAARVLLPWQNDLPAHTQHAHAAAQSSAHDCGHAQQASSAHSDETGRCQIRCDLATAMAVVPVSAFELPELPEVRTAIQPVLTLGITATPDHPPPIA